MADTHPDAIAARLKGFQEKLVEVGVESGPFTQHLHRSLASLGFPMVGMEARRAADAIKSRRIKSDKADAWALAEMLRTGWFTAVHVKSAESHKIKTLLGARDRLQSADTDVGLGISKQGDAMAWKGRGLWSTYATRAPFHMEGGKGTKPKVVKFQLRPDPLGGQAPRA